MGVGLPAGRADELFEQNSTLLLAKSALENAGADRALQLAVMADREAEHGTIKQFMEDKLLDYVRQLGHHLGDVSSASPQLHTATRAV